MVRLEDINDIKQLKTNDDGLHIDVEIYKNEDDEQGEFSVYISHNGSSGCEYNGLTTSDDIAESISSYIEFNM